jgi:hypothetical protein
MRVLIGCEFSGIVRDAFIALGHDAWSCDLLDTETPGPHIKGDVLEHLEDGFDLGIFHPPCTYLTNAGVRHLHDSNTSVNGVRARVHGEARMQAMREAAAFFNALKQCSIPRTAIENPTPHKYARALIGPYQQAIQPWEFGEPETKRTCLWLKNLPPLMATIIETRRDPKCHMMSPSPDRWKNRSRTKPGIARAMAAQWGNPMLFLPQPQPEIWQE